MAARRVAVWLLEEQPHRSDNFRGNGSAGIEIEVDALRISSHLGFTVFRRIAKHCTLPQQRSINSGSLESKCEKGEITSGEHGVASEADCRNLRCRNLGTFFRPSDRHSGPF